MRPPRAARNVDMLRLMYCRGLWDLAGNLPQLQVMKYHLKGSDTRAADDDVIKVKYSWTCTKRYGFFAEVNRYAEVSLCTIQRMGQQDQNFRI
jgi:hypothetical protein